MSEFGTQVTFDVDGNKYVDEDSATADMVDRFEEQEKRIQDAGRLKEDLEDKGKTVDAKVYEEGKDRR